MLQRIGECKCAAPRSAGDDPLLYAQMLPYGLDVFDVFDVFDQGLGRVLREMVQVVLNDGSAIAATALVQTEEHRVGQLALTGNFATLPDRIIDFSLSAFYLRLTILEFQWSIQLAPCHI